MAPLTIYKSSAGSGKTYTLAKEYLRMALLEPQYYRHILAVTFTNRAAEEMKERVLDFLIAISQNKHELVGVLASEMNVPEGEIVRRAQATLSDLLHHYGYFSIMTIDTFFHRVIRAFSREIGLQGNFGIELDTKKVAALLADAVYTGAEENAQLRQWLLDFSMEQLMDAKSYDLKNEVTELAEQLFSEQFKLIARSLMLGDDQKENIRALRKVLSERKYAFENFLKGIGKEFFEVLRKNGLEGADLKGASRSTVANFFRKLENCNYDTLVNKTIEKAVDDSTEWGTKSSDKYALIISLAESHFMPLAKKAIDYYTQNLTAYNTAIIVLKNLYTLGLMTDLAQRLAEYKTEEEIIMISDLPDFLNQIIDDSGSPFIYEKVGSRYKHYLIDEFQDTSRLQWRNFKPLLEESMANGHSNILVGDAKQSIYAWRGGDPTLLMRDVEREIAGPDIQANTINWRSAKNVVEFNNELFTKLPDMLCELMDEVLGDEEKSLMRAAYVETAQKVAPKHAASEGLVHVEFLEKQENETWSETALQRTVQLIEDLLTAGHQLNDIAMLVRTNSEATELVNYVLDYKRTNDTSIEVISAEGMLLSNSMVVQVLISAYRHLVVPQDKAALANLVYSYQRYHGKPFEKHSDFQKLTEAGLPEQFVKHKEHLLHLPILELTEVLVRTFDLTKVKSEFAYLQAFQDAVLDYSKNRRSDIRLFLEWWEEVEGKRSVQLTGTLDAVEIITLHKSKGLEFPIVIVPFCNFQLNSRDHHSWYSADIGEPYSTVPYLPVDYSKTLNESLFKEQYRKELVKWHLESLNMLYVTFTRAENGLFAFCEPSGSTSNPYSNVSNLLAHYFNTHPMEGWDANSRIFKKGKLPVKHRESKDQLVSLAEFPTHKWSTKLTIRKTGKAYYDDEAQKQRNEGILLHQILSEIKHWNQTTDVLDRYEKRMEITAEDRKNYEKIISALWENAQVKPWFEDGYEIKTEVVVLPEDGETKRMDRVLLKGTEAIVIDFKSGAPKPDDSNQLQEYVALLGRMGYEAKGYLLYLKSGEVVG
jgi:ATP-dependent helicase/nuclease subunit A